MKNIRAYYVSYMVNNGNCKSDKVVIDNAAVEVNKDTILEALIRRRPDLSNKTFIFGWSQCLDINDTEVKREEAAKVVEMKAAKKTIEPNPKPLNPEIEFTGFNTPVF